MIIKLLNISPETKYSLVKELVSEDNLKRIFEEVDEHNKDVNEKYFGNVKKIKEESLDYKTEVSMF